MASRTHSPLTRFITGAFSLVGGAAAGQALTAATTGIAISTPVGWAILGGLAAFAGGAAIYKGVKAAEADAQTKEILNYLEQLIKQHGNLAQALAALPPDLPFSHADSCERIRQLAAIFAPGPEGVEQRLADHKSFMIFATDAMKIIEAQNNAQQADLNRLIQMAFDAKVLSEDQLAAIDIVTQSLAELHTKADEHSQKLDQALRMLEKLQSTSEATDQSDESTNRDLASAVQRLADDAARGVHTAERILETNDPNAVPTYLKARRTKLLEAQAALNERITAEAIQIDRELAATAFVTGQINEAIEALERILSLVPNDLYAINQLGHVHGLRGDLHASETQYNRLLQLDPSDITKAIAFDNLGLIERTRGNLDAAEDYFNRSLAIEETLGREEGVADTLSNLALIETTRGNLDTAEQYLKRSLSLNETLGRNGGVAIVLGNLGGIEVIRGNLDAAENYYKRALAIDEAIGHKEAMASGLGNLGVIEMTRGNLDAAETYLNRSLVINEALGRKEGMAIQLGNLGGIEMTRGNLDAAEAYFNRSLAINETLGCREGIASTLGNLGGIEMTRGNLDIAEVYHKRSLAIEEALNHKEGVASDLGNLGVVEITRGNLDAASDLWTRSRDLYAQIGMPHMATKLQSWLDTLPDPK